MLASESIPHQWQQIWAIPRPNISVIGLSDTGVTKLIMYTSLLSEETFPLSDGLLAAQTVNEWLMMRVELDLYFNLSAMDSRIWVLLEEVCLPQEIVVALLAEYEVSAEIVDEALRTPLCALYQRDLLVVSDVKAA